tara:strand:- start:2687 stop:3031 length:345 start_codon:yes stop_codon:yes gene_type:complete
MKHILDNALMSLTGSGFAIYGDVTNSSQYESGVVFKDPSVKPSWEAVEAQKIVEAWNYVRVERNKRIAKSDWTQLGDVTMSGELLANWQSYRQSLRDVPTQSDPFNITWPTPPA